MELPDVQTLIRRKAFGAKVPTQAEEEALQYAFSGHELVTKVEKARSALVRRGQQQKAEGWRTAEELAIGEIAGALEEEIRRLKQLLAERSQNAGQTPAEQSGIRPGSIAARAKKNQPKRAR